MQRFASQLCRRRWGTCRSNTLAVVLGTPDNTPSACPPISQAKANRAKYRGVSADQMRASSFAGAGSGSFGRVSHTAGSLQLGGSSFSGGGGGLSRR